MPRMTSGMNVRMPMTLVDLVRQEAQRRRQTGPEYVRAAIIAAIARDKG